MPDINRCMVKSPRIASEYRLKTYNILWPYMSHPVVRRNQGMCGFWSIPRSFALGFTSDEANSKGLGQQEQESSPKRWPHRPPVLLRAVRSELCAALGSWCFWVDFAEMVFGHSLHYPTRRHHDSCIRLLSRVPETLHTDYQQDAWYFGGSLCNTKSIDAHSFSWHEFSWVFLLSMNLFQRVMLCRPDRFGSVVQSSQRGASQRGLRVCPRSTNSLSFEGTEEQGLKRITSIIHPYIFIYIYTYIYIYWFIYLFIYIIIHLFI